MRIFDLQEARRNPDTNNGSKNGDGIKQLLSWSEEKDCFVTFTNIAKVGINPNSTYNTPIGVYAYPLNDPKIIEHIESDTLPFVSDAKHINVMKLSAPTMRVVHLDDDQARFKELNQHVTEWLAGKLNIVEGETRISREKAQALIWEKVYGYAVRNAKHHSAGGIWWNYTRVAALLVRAEGDMSMTQHDIGVATSSAEYNDNASSALWTHVLLATGVDVVIDNGSGIIHDNEPTQAVFFSTRAFKVVGRIFNPRQLNESIHIFTVQEFSRFIFRCGESIAPNICAMLQGITASDDTEITATLPNQYTNKLETKRVYISPTGQVANYFVAAERWVIKLSMEARAALATKIVTRISYSKNNESLWVNFLITTVGKEKAAQMVWGLFAPTEKSTAESDPEAASEYEAFKQKYNL